MAATVVVQVPAELLAADIPQADTTCTVDARGLYCPQPIVRLSQAIRRNPQQGVFLLECTDPGTVPDLLRWARPWGHTVMAMRVSATSQPALYQFWVQAKPM